MLDSRWLELNGTSHAANTANWQIIDLGSSVLRTETAAVALAAFVALGSQGPQM